MDELNNTQYPHLNTNASEYMDKTDPERIHYIRSPRWIGYPHAKQLLTSLKDLQDTPRKHRMPNALIVGDSNAGKTMIAERFHKLNPAYEREDGEGLVIPVLYIQAPAVPSESRLYSNILEKLFAPYYPSYSAEKKYYQVIELMKYCNVKMLMIDEIHSILAGNMEKQRIFLSVLRNLGNELQIPIVALGTKDALRAISTDPQLENRFKYYSLPRWEYDTNYKRLLASYECMLPLAEPSNLPQKTMAMKLLSMSDGLLGELSDLLAEAAIEAIRTGQERINLTLLEHLDWQSPSQRRGRNA